MATRRRQFRGGPGLPLAGGGGRSGQVPLFRERTVLSHDQTRQLPSVPVTIVASRGENKIIQPVACFAVCNFVAGAYTMEAEASWVLTIGGIYVSCLAPVAELTNGHTHLAFAIPKTIPAHDAFPGESQVFSFVDPGAQIATIANQPLKIEDSFWGVNDYTSGHADNTVTITTFFALAEL